MITGNLIKFYLFVSHGVSRCLTVSRLQVSVVNGLVIIMLIVGVHHVVTGLAVHRTGEVASVGANLKYFTVIRNHVTREWKIPSTKNYHGGDN